jgi:membrane protease YdiL (CAAX protease family)
MALIQPSYEEKLFRGVLRLNTKLLSLVLGLLFGLLIFVATNWLVIKGGHVTNGGEYVVGPHLELLNQFFVGYNVSFLGSIVGFFYGFAIGTLSGSLIGWVYNKFVDFRNPQSQSNARED